MTDREKLEQMLDQIDVMVRALDVSDHYQDEAVVHLSRASGAISAAIRQEQINENVDFCATLEE